MKHKLRIVSLNDGQAVCICGRWYYTYTGKSLSTEIEAEFRKHKCRYPTIAKQTKGEKQ